MMLTPDAPSTQDWLRTRSWDLPQEIDRFLEIVPPERLEHFMTLPAAQAMPEHLRAALELVGLL